MPATRFALWRDRLLRLWLAGGASAVGAIGSVIRNKWLALHLETAGIGVLGQIFAGQTWLGTATGVGLGLPVAQQIGEALGRGDRAAVRRTVSTALAVLLTSSLAVAAVGLIAAPWISTALLGTPEHAMLVRISMLSVIGIAFQPTVQGLFAGFSDVRATFVYALLGNTAVVALVLTLVPRFGLAGAVWSMAAFWPVAILGTLWIERRAYATALASPEGARFDRASANAMLKVAAVALGLALLDQGTLLMLRAHYIRAHGASANGLLQAAIALAQQGGAVFYGYLGGYAFGMISRTPGVEAVRAYTRKQFAPVAGLATLGFAFAMIASGPLLHLLYSDRFDPARPMLGWTMVGEFGKVVLMTWSLGALRLGGVRLWLLVSASWPAGMLIGYLVALAAGAGVMSLPFAYAAAGAISVSWTALSMTRRGVSLDRRGLAIVVVGGLLLAVLAAYTSGVFRG
jgi:O-antigen/teichoic acid export membrane protein